MHFPYYTYKASSTVVKLYIAPAAYKNV